MSENELRIVLTDQEKDDTPGTVAIKFAIWNGSVVITEEWAQEDELFSDGVQIRIPPRVWAEGMKWVQERLT